MVDLKLYIENGSTTLSNLILKYYKKIQLTDREFLLYLQLLQFQQEGKSFPDMTQVAERMSVAMEEIFPVIESLLNKQVIELITYQNEQGKTTDAYDLSPVFEKIDNYLKSQQKEKEVIGKEEEVAQLFQMFEKEFGRPLSPIELETIGYWIEDDQYEVEVIKLALREAVLNQAYSLKYIDRILLSWERKNLRSKEQILEEQKKRKKTLSQQDKERIQNEPKELPKVPLYNWTEPKNNK